MDGISLKFGPFSIAASIPALSDSVNNPTGSTSGLSEAHGEQILVSSLLKALAMPSNDGNTKNTARKFTTAIVKISQEDWRGVLFSSKVRRPIYAWAADAAVRPESGH